MPVEVKCQQCDKIFTVDPYKKTTAKYCSQECFRKARQRRIKRICKHCGNSFKIKRSIVKKGKGKFCSKKCFDEFQEKKIELTCENCGISFKVVPSRIETAKYCSSKCAGNAPNKLFLKCEYCGKEFKTKASEVKVGKGKYCSKECYWKDISNKRKGPDNPKWSRTERTCEYCGKKFYAKAHVIRDGYGKYCSLKCKQKDMVGNKAPTWQGGISFEPYCHKFNREFKKESEISGNVNVEFVANLK